MCVAWSFILHQRDKCNLTFNLTSHTDACASLYNVSECKAPKILCLPSKGSIFVKWMLFLLFSIFFFSKCFTLANCHNLFFKLIFLFHGICYRILNQMRSHLPDDLFMNYFNLFIHPKNIGFRRCDSWIGYAERRLIQRFYTHYAIVKRQLDLMDIRHTRRRWRASRRGWQLTRATKQ